MNIKDFLSPADVAIDVQTSDKNELLRVLTDRLSRSRNLPPAVVVAALLTREELGSTGTGSGVAIPHARIPIVQKVTGFLARLDRAIEFDAIDDQPVDLVFVLLLPTNSEAQQLRALACVARKLRSPETPVKLRGAKNKLELYAAIAD